LAESTESARSAPSVLGRVTSPTLRRPAQSLVGLGHFWPLVRCLDQREDPVGETAGEPGERFAILGAPAGERLVQQQATALVDRLDDPAAVGGELGGLDPADLVAAGPYDLVVDYVWGSPAEATFEALARLGAEVPRARYVLVGMTAGELAGLPAMALRRAPIELIGSGFRGPAGLEAAAEGFHGVLELVANGELQIDIDVVPLTEVEKVWPTATSDRRVVFVP
jgi:hypothetical protein